MPRPKRRSSFKVKKTHRPCTYELGYVRQDLYACRKCTDAVNGVHSGFCAGCRETCHADHPEEVFELYTKRNFRCDCGNSRARNTCLLQPYKDDLNVGNQPSYSHNFSSRYCRCDREYEMGLAMAQCAMCEDWFHEECYKTDGARRAGHAQPFADEYEFTCKACVSKLPVLSDYYEKFHAWTSVPDVRKWRAENFKKTCSRPTPGTARCKSGSIDLQWRPGFRVHLCRCAKCMELYRVGNSLYIVDRSDFVNTVDDDDMLEVFVDTPDEDVIKMEDVVMDDPCIQKDCDDNSFDNALKTAPENIRISNGIKAAPNEESVDCIRRRRMLSFLQNLSGKKEPGHDEMAGYVTDLTADLLATFRQRLDAPMGDMTNIT